MTIAAFLDAGLSFEKLSKELLKLKIKGYLLKSSMVRRGGIAGTKFDCVVRSETHSRSLNSILSMISASSLSPRVKSIASSIFRSIGDAESKVHGRRGQSDVLFHELGSVDSIVDIVGTAVAVDELGIDEIRASVVNTGRGFVDSAHGVLPVPSPASLEILKGVPVEISEIASELVTPTGAGIIKTLAKGFGRMPRMTIERTGYGAGSKDLREQPNLLRVVIGRTEEAFLEDRVSVIETNIDDMSPQHFGYLFEKLFGEGALDVYTTPVQMKKSRPALLLTVLVRARDLDRVSSVIFSETTSIGVRFYEARRFKLERKTVKAKTRYGNIAVKVGSGPGGITTVSPEYEECAKIARTRNVPFKTVYDEAKKAVLK